MAVLGLCVQAAGPAFTSLSVPLLPPAAGMLPWPLQELEQQLVEAAEEKTKVQSKFHELSIKHRQLIETSPQVGMAGFVSSSGSNCISSHNSSSHGSSSS